MAEVVGWVSSFVLLLTIGSQVYKQWHDRTARGVSRWFFIGQVAASIGFVVYSAMLGNTIFIVTNATILLSAVAGLIITHRNKRRDAHTDHARQSGPASP